MDWDKIYYEFLKGAKYLMLVSLTVIGLLVVTIEVLGKMNPEILIVGTVGMIFYFESYNFFDRRLEKMGGEVRS